MGLPAPDQEKAAGLLNPLAVVDAKDEKDNPETVESVFMNEVFPKGELSAFMLALLGAGLKDTLPKELSP